MDVEPAVAAWDTDAATLEEGVARVTSELAQLPAVRQVVFLTNSPRRAMPATGEFTYRARARKPWRLWTLRTLPAPVVVIGDQVLTDGLLAHRLGAAFVHLPHHGRMPWWPAAQALAGRFVRRVLFREAP